MPLVIVEESSAPEALRTVASLAGTAVACSARAALLTALGRAGATDVLVTSWPLERAEALALLGEIRAASPGAHVLLLSPACDPASVAQAYDAGASDHAPAPCDPAELTARIRAASRAGEVCATSGGATRAREQLRPITTSASWQHIQQPVGASLGMALGEAFPVAVAPSAPAPDDGLAATITLAEPERGVEVGVGIAVCPRGAVACATRMFGEPMDDPAVLADLVGELSNIVSGAVKDALSRDGLSLVARTPRRQRARDYEASWLAFDEHRVLLVDLGEGALAVRVGLRWRGTCRVRTCALLENMVVAEDVLTTAGALVVARGTRLTSSMAERIARFVPRAEIAVCLV